MINRYNLDLLVVTETCLKNTYKDQTWVHSSEINRNNLKFKHITEQINGVVDLH